jgi:4-carboxymuconolactone decarboxylase
LVAAGNGRFPVGPVGVWLNRPELALRATALGRYIAHETGLPRRLKELAVLVTARVWTAQYEWHAHAAWAAEAGLDPAIIDAIAARLPPPFTDAAAAAVHDFALALHTHRRVDDALYARTAAALGGEAALVDLVAVLGFYGFVSMSLNTFDVPLPAGAAPPLAD